MGNLFANAFRRSCNTVVVGSHSRREQPHSCSCRCPSSATPATLFRLCQRRGGTSSGTPSLIVLHWTSQEALSAPAAADSARWPAQRALPVRAPTPARGSKETPLARAPTGLRPKLVSASAPVPSLPMLPGLLDWGNVDQPGSPCIESSRTHWPSRSMRACHTTVCTQASHLASALAALPAVPLPVAAPPRPAFGSEWARALRISCSGHLHRCSLDLVDWSLISVWRDLSTRRILAQQLHLPSELLLSATIPLAVSPLLDLWRLLP